MRDTAKRATRVNGRRFRLVMAGMLIVFVLLRVWLHISPNSDLNVGPYNIHHLFTGLLLIAIGGLPLSFLEGRGPLLDAFAVIFGVGLGMALDEWVYLIATDGTNASYLLPVSFWGAVVVIALASIYALALRFWLGRKQGDE